MIIKGKRKRKLDKQLKTLLRGHKIRFGVTVDEDIKNTIIKIGFTEEANIGETVLPSCRFGPVCRFNAEGKYKVHKDKPMETAYRQVEWTWEQWAGYHETETRSKVVDVPYKRYPRTLLRPPGIELSVTQNSSGKKYIVTPEMESTLQNQEELLHAINILLEIFGYCEILHKDLEGYAIKNLKRLNWKILPPGKWPWGKFKREVDPLVQKASKQNQIVIRYRLEAITKFEPEFSAIGQAGFAGYLIFGFPDKNLYILESLYSGNATYVFEQRWEELSKLTKAEILEGRLQKDRIIHREGWEFRINRILK